MLIYESMHSLLVLYDYIRSYVIRNMVAKTGPKVAKTGTSTLHKKRKIKKIGICVGKMFLSNTRAGIATSEAR